MTTWFVPIETRQKIEIGYNGDYDQPYWVDITFSGHASYEKYSEVHAWVNDKFGAKSNTWNNPRWSASNHKYWFKYEKDRTLFVLRWS